MLNSPFLRGRESHIQRQLLVFHISDATNDSRYHQKALVLEMLPRLSIPRTKTLSAEPMDPTSGVYRQPFDLTRQGQSDTLLPSAWWLTACLDASKDPNRGLRLHGKERAAHRKSWESDGGVLKATTRSLMRRWAAGVASLMPSGACILHVYLGIRHL